MKAPCLDSVLDLKTADLLYMEEVVPTMAYNLCAGVLRLYESYRRSATVYDVLLPKSSASKSM